MYDTISPRIGGADSVLEKQAKELMIDAYEQMRDETDQTKLDPLWDQVGQGKKVLDQERERRIREYERQHSKIKRFLSKFQKRERRRPT